MVEARLDTSSTRIVLKVKETISLWPEESARTGTTVTSREHVESMQWRHLNVFNKECVIVKGCPRFALVTIAECTVPSTQWRAASTAPGSLLSFP